MQLLTKKWPKTISSVSLIVSTPILVVKLVKNCAKINMCIISVRPFIGTDKLDWKTVSESTIMPACDTMQKPPNNGLKAFNSSYGTKVSSQPTHMTSTLLKN